jgi:transposase
MQFAEMTDRQWNAIRPHLPRPAVAGRPGADDRTTINAIMFVPVTGCRRVDLPAPYGSKSSAHRRLQSLQQNGGLGGDITPSEAALIKVDGDNKWQTIIQNASLNRDQE